MRTITKVMMVRTIFDPSAPRIQNMHDTVQHILNFDLEKVRIHPSDGRRVIHALRYFIQDIDQNRLSRL
uniref:Uncharacterized protein n=1 Tax=viral metagenome TaxID=1070528 RepID=A0A6C0HXJ9_9ZZZZ